MSHPRATHGLGEIEMIPLLVRLFPSLLLGCELLARKDPAEKCAKAVDEGVSGSALLIFGAGSLLVLLWGAVGCRAVGFSPQPWPLPTTRL